MTQIIANIAVLFFVVPIIAILLNNLVSKHTSEKIGLYIAGTVAVFQIAAATAEFFLLAGNRLHDYHFALLWNVNRAGAESFALNALSLVIMFCIGLVSLISVLIANQTIGKRKKEYVNLLMTLILGMNGMLIVTDLFSLYVFLEVVGISSFVLISMYRSGTGLEGAFKYLIMSSLASILILTGLSFIFMKTGSLRYTDVGNGVLDGQNTLIYAALILIISGFAIKTGAAPFHSWLPDAHQSADTAVSVLLSGIVIKVAGIYGFIVLTSLFKNVPAINMTLAVIGLVTIVTGALFALVQTHFKRIAAYSSVSQMGYILLGLSTGSTLGLLGAVVHIFNHATFKSTLFANAAALHERTDTLDITEMGGLQARMPVTGVSSTVAFLSTAGIPPFAGFWSKLLILMALWQADSEGFAVVALLASILTAAYFLRLQKSVFFGKLSDKFKEVTEVRGSVKFAEILLTAIMTVCGLAFPLALLYLRGRGII